MKIKILNVVGARPNFMKIAPINRELSRFPEFSTTLLHTGQHYSPNMSKLIFEDLGLPHPDIYLGVGSGSHGEQTGKVMFEFEKICLEHRPDIVIVVGDVNSTLACSVVATKLGIKVAHVEAGLRSFDRSMPEEINRLLTDQISDLLFITEESGRANLLREGVAEDKIHFVGNVMIDALLTHRAKASESQILDSLRIKPGEYIAMTLHRPSNVDSKEQMQIILGALVQLQKHLPIVFPIHPRSKASLEKFGLLAEIEKSPNLILSEPLGYLDFLRLMSCARLVLTDSGGIQEETTVLEVPCLTLRENTERPVTVAQGTNTVIGTDPERIVTESLKVLEGKGKVGRRPDLWDGRAAERIAQVLLEYFRGQ